MPELTLTRHFEERWMERVGNWPTVEAIAHFIRQSVRVQRGKTIELRDGSVCKILSIYWHPELDLVLKLDEEKSAVVTVLSRDNFKNNGKKE